MDLLRDFFFTYNNSTYILSTNNSVNIFDMNNINVKALQVSTELNKSKESLNVYNTNESLREATMSWRAKWVIENPSWNKDKDLRVYPKYTTDPFYSPKSQQILDLTDPYKIGYNTNIDVHMEYNFDMSRFPVRLRHINATQSYCNWKEYKDSSIDVYMTRRMVDGDVLFINYDPLFFNLDGYVLRICNAVRESLVSYFRDVYKNYDASDVVNNFAMYNVIVNEGHGIDGYTLLQAFYRCDYGNNLPVLGAGDPTNAVYPFSDSYKNALERSLKPSKTVRFSEPTLLDAYPTFKRLIEASKSYRLYAAEISLDIQDQLSSMLDESHVIITRLLGINEEFLQITHLNYIRQYEQILQEKVFYDTKYGGENYHSNFCRWRGVFIRLDYMCNMRIYMSPSESQFFWEARGTIMSLRWGHASLYHLKAKTSLLISGLDHNSLMFEVEGLLVKNPFDPQ
jgi:hypothetical protein